MDSEGNGVFTWQALAGGTFRAQARTYSAAGALSEIQSISPTSHNVFICSPGDCGHPQIAVDAGGNAVIAWQDFNTGQIFARTRSAEGLLGSVDALSAGGQYATNQQVAVAPGGDAVVVWQRFDGTNLRAQAAFGP